MIYNSYYRCALCYCYSERSVTVTTLPRKGEEAESIVESNPLHSHKQRSDVLAQHSSRKKN